MPSFTFTSPQGKQYTVTGPDGSTQEQAFGILQQQLASAPQPAAQQQQSSPAASGEQYQLVNVPGVGQLRFPAGMSQQDMATAIQKNFPQIHGQSAAGGSPPNTGRFDVQGALKAGYSPAEVADYLGQQSKFDVAGARKAGYSDQEIISHLTQPGSFVPAPPTSAENFDAGVGKAFVDAGRGAKQLALQWGNKLGIVSNQHLSDYQQQLDDESKYDAKLMSTTGGKLGDLTGNIAMAAVAPEEAGLKGAVATGAALGGLQPTTGDESHLENTALGAAGGLAGDIGGRVIGRAIQPIRSVLSDGMVKAVQLLRQAGVPLDLAQATGSRIATTLKNLAADAPFLSPSGFSEVQQKAYNAAVLRSFGASGTKASPTVMDAAAKRIGATFDDIASRNPVTIDSPLLDDLATLHETAGHELSSTDAAPIKAQIDNIVNKAADNGGKLDGSQYQAVSSSLGRLSKYSPNGSIRHFAGEIRSSLDDALQRSVSPQDLDTLASARRQYRAMKQTEEAINATDDVSPSTLANVIDRKSNASQSVYGRGDQTLVQLANAGKVVLGQGRSNGENVRRLLGFAAVGMGGDAVYRLARGQGIDKADMMQAAIAGGFAPMAARAVVESPAGREWLGRWANSQIAKRVAAGALTAGRRIGPGISALINAVGSPTEPTPSPTAQQQ